MTSWLVDTFQMEPGWARGIGFFIAVVVVLALISVFVWVLRRIAGTRVMGGRSRQPRVSVMDAAALDARRRLILIRRDNVEHLLLVGGPSDVVVERNIVRGVPVSQAYPRQSSQPAVDVAAASLAPVESAPPQPQPEPAPRAPAQRPAAPPPPAAAPAPRRMAPPAPAASAPAQQPQPIRPSPRAATPPPPRAPSAEAPASGSAEPKRPTPLHRAGASVAAAGAAVAGLARSSGSALRGSDQAQDAAPRADTPPAPRRTITPPSSGPASTARTAYPQPGDEPKAPEVAPPAPSTNGTPPRPTYVKPPVEPVAARHPSPDTPAKDPAATAPEIKAPEPAKPAKDESSAAPDTPVRAPTSSGQAQSASSGSWPSAPSSSWKDRQTAAAPVASPKPDVAPVADTASERKEATAEKPEDMQKVSDEPAPVEAKAVAQDAPSKVSADDLEDALMAEFNQSRKPQAAAEATATQDAGTETPAEAGPAAPEAGTDEQAGSADPSSEDTAPADDKKDPANAVTMDAIEEEMARLLSEIGGSKPK